MTEIKGQLHKSSAEIKEVKQCAEAPELVVPGTLKETS